MAKLSRREAQKHEKCLQILSQETIKSLGQLPRHE